jgi:hypothetical protein
MTTNEENAMETVSNGMRRILTSVLLVGLLGVYHYWDLETALWGAVACYMGFGLSGVLCGLFVLATENRKP